MWNAVLFDGVLSLKGEVIMNEVNDVLEGLKECEVDAEKIYSYLEKLPADVFIALYHKMIQSINYPFGINHCV